VTNRERLIQFAAMLLAAVVAAIGSRYGFPPPAPPAPPAKPAPPGMDELDPPAVRPAPMPAPAPNTPAAIGRIQFGSAGCTATVIGPRRPDGRYWVLTASHCVGGVGAHGTMRLLDGRTFGIIVDALDRRADWCWCHTESNSEVFPFALLADATPPAGTPIWHAGYGVDRPGNREDGTVDAGPDSNGQIRMTLSVSSGDSGGGICTTAEGRVVSCVCCTAARGQRSQVWGASVEAIRRGLPTSMVVDGWTPIEVPLRKEPPE